jgi:TonB family protein
MESSFPQGMDAGELPVPAAGDPAFDAAPLSAFEDLLAACEARIFALTADPDLVAGLQRIRGGHRAIEISTDWTGLAAALDSGGCGIVLLDMDHLGATLDERLAELERRTAPPVILGAASRSDASEMMNALMARRIHRLLIKPATSGKIRLLLESAIHRCMQASDAPVRAARAAGGRGTPGRGALAAGIVLVAGLLVGGGLWWRGGPAPAPEPEPVPTAATTPELLRVQPLERIGPPPDPFAEELALAQAAFDAGRLIDPPEDNALDRFAAILAVEPEHAAAAEGLGATIAVLFTWAESALLGDVLELAANTLERVRQVRPESARLAFLDAQVARALEQQEAAARAQSAAAEPQPREVDRLLGLARSRLQRGQLVQPPGNNALTYFRQAAALEPADRGVVALRVRLGAAIVEAARTLLAAGDTAQAEALIGEARHLGADTAVVAELDARLGEIRTAQRQERQAGLLELGRERLREGWLIAPEKDSAAHYLASLRAENPAYPGLPASWGALTTALRESFLGSVIAADWSGAERWLAGLRQVDADGELVETLAAQLAVARTQAEFLHVAVPAEELVLTTFRAPTYPENALRNGTQGWVELEFIVGRDGQPRDIVIAEAEPPGVFDRAAIGAVNRYRYEPFEQDGVVYERRARLRIRFALR